MTLSERRYWMLQKGKACRVAYDPPDDRGVIVGIRLGRSYPASDKVVVRFSDGSRMSLWPNQVEVID